MSQSRVTSEAVTSMLDHVPGVFFASRVNVATGATEWLYTSPKMHEIYGLTAEELAKDPAAILRNMLPEDLARLETLMVQGSQTALERGTARMSWTGRIAYAPGKIRWVETQSNIVRDDEGMLRWYGQLLDVTERKATEQALAESEAERARADAIYRKVIDTLPVGIVVVDTSRRFLVSNPAMQQYVGPTAPKPGEDLSRRFGAFRADGETPLPIEDTAMVRALRGEEATEEVVVRNPHVGGERRLDVKAVPLRDEHGAISGSLVVTQDITMQRALEAELRARNTQLAASEEAKSALIDRLRVAIEELSNPILEVWEGVLSMPIIGVVDSRRTADMTHRLLGEVTRTQASFVIIDLTGVEVVDTKTADHVVKLMRKVEVVGARCLLTGIRPAVADTLVDLGVDFGKMSTLRNLKHGLREAIRTTRRERAALNDEEMDDVLTERAPARRPRG